MGELVPIHYGRMTPSDVRPCPARAQGPFLGCDADELRCGGIEGHAGTHYFHVEWGPGNLRWTPAPVSTGEEGPDA